MSQPRHPQGFRTAPWGFLGAVVLVALIERAIADHSLAMSELAAVNWSYSQRAARTIAPRKEILCFGTSLLKFGLLSRSIEAATGRSVYNLAACNGHVPTSYYLFKHALDAGARPTAILVDCQDGPLSPEDRVQQAEALRVNLRNWPELLSVRDCFELSWHARDATFFVSTLLRKVVPSYKCRYEVRGVVRLAIEDFDYSVLAYNTVFLRNWNANLGTTVMPATPSKPENDANPPPPPEASPSQFDERTWSRSPLTELYLRRFLELAATHDVAVFWLVPPVTPHSVSMRAAEGLDRYYWNLANRAEEIYPRVTVIDASRSDFPLRLFCDKAHLNSEGASIFSEQVAAVVARTLAEGRPGPGWFELPRSVPVRAHTSGLIEDLDSSRAAVRERRAGIRQ